MSEERMIGDYLEDILDAATKIVEFSEGMSYEEFAIDDKTVFAVIRAFEVMGEASKNIPPAYQQQYADFPWREMARMRDVLIHHYFGINRKVVWLTATEQVPQLLPSLQRMVDEIVE